MKEFKYIIGLLIWIPNIPTIFMLSIMLYIALRFSSVYEHIPYKKLTAEMFGFTYWQCTNLNFD